MQCPRRCKEGINWALCAAFATCRNLATARPAGGTNRFSWRPWLAAPLFRGAAAVLGAATRWLTASRRLSLRCEKPGGPKMACSALYRQSKLGTSLVDALDQLVEEGRLPPQLALRVLEEVRPLRSLTAL